jgi:hypothetical protein
VDRIRIYTTAPDSYDYGDTMDTGVVGETRNGEAVRLVLCTPEGGFGIDMQRARYASGSHMNLTEEEWNAQKELRFVKEY